MTKKETVKKELLELLDDPRTGLRDSSDTNKTRCSILALFEQNLEAYKEELRGEIEKIQNLNDSSDMMYQGGVFDTCTRVLALLLSTDADNAWGGYLLYKTTEKLEVIGNIYELKN